MSHRKISGTVLFSSLLWVAVSCFAQQSKTDSLLSLLKKDKQDTSKVIHLYQLTWECYLTGDYEKGLNYGNESLELAHKLNFKKGIANAYNNVGNIYRLQADYSKALGFFLKALKIDEELFNSAPNGKGREGDKSGMATRLGNIGNIYLQQADYPKALDYYLKALKTFEELGNKNGIAAVLGNIGIVYKEQAETHPNPSQREGLYEKALDYYFKALKMKEELGNKNGIANTLGNIGIVYDEQKDYPKALETYFKALKMDEELGNKNGIAADLGNIGSLYTSLGKFNEAEVYLKKAIAIDDSIGALDDLMQFEEEISQLYDTTAQLAVGNEQLAKAAENYKLSMLYYKKAMVLKDTLFSEENKKQLVRKEMNYEFDKKKPQQKRSRKKKMSLPKNN